MRKETAKEIFNDINKSAFIEHLNAEQQLELMNILKEYLPKGDKDNLIQKDLQRAKSATKQK